MVRGRIVLFLLSFGLSYAAWGNGTSAEDVCTAEAQVAPPSTGSDATLIVEPNGLPTGTCLIVTGEDGRVVGRSIIRTGQSAVIVRGDDPMTPDVLDGARNGEQLQIRLVNADGRIRVAELLTGQPLSTLQYRTDALWKAVVDEETTPHAFELAQNYPNPFNPRTTIHYTVPEATHVQLEVFNVLGEQVAMLVDGAHEPGSYEVSLDGSQLASGFYLYRLQAGSEQLMRTMTLVK